MHAGSLHVESGGWIRIRQVGIRTNCTGVQLETVRDPARDSDAIFGGFGCLGPYPATRSFLQEEFLAQYPGTRALSRYNILPPRLLFIASGCNRCSTTLPGCNRFRKHAPNSCNYGSSNRRDQTCLDGRSGSPS